MRLFEKLAQPPVLWASLALTIICTAAFQLLAAHFSLSYLDAMTDPDQSREAIAAMSASQRAVHAWITGTLDVAYPAVYGALFAGSAYRFFPRFARYLVAPIIVLVAIDLVEGLVQILALTEVKDWLDAKAVLTTAKLALFYYGLLMTVSGWVVWLVSRRAA